MNTETVSVIPHGEEFNINITHDQTGSIYGIILSKTAYEQLREHFINGSLPMDEEIINNCPQSSFGMRETWMSGVIWLKERVLKSNN